MPFNYFEFKVEVVPVHWGVRSSYCGRGMSMQSLLKGTKRHIEVESLVPGGSMLNTKIKFMQYRGNLTAKLNNGKTRAQGRGQLP